MPRIETSVHRSRVTLDIFDFDIEEQADALREALGAIIPIMEKILETEVVWQNLEDDERALRVRPHLAMSMKVRGRLAAALQEAENHRQVICGDASISSHGFPEFENEATHDV